MSKTSIPSTSDIKRDLQSNQNVCTLDVRNHHRIWDAQKHLLVTLFRLEEKLVDKSIINVIIQKNVENF